MASRTQRVVGLVLVQILAWAVFILVIPFVLLSYPVTWLVEAWRSEWNRP